jgi:hypothetical protein
MRRDCITVGTTTTRRKSRADIVATLYHLATSFHGHHGSDVVRAKELERVLQYMIFVAAFIQKHSFSSGAKVQSHMGTFAMFYVREMRTEKARS